MLSSAGPKINHIMISPTNHQLNNISWGAILTQTNFIPSPLALATDMSPRGKRMMHFPSNHVFPHICTEKFSPTFRDNKCQKQPTDAAAAASAVSQVVLLRLGNVLRSSCFFLSCWVSRHFDGLILSECHKMPRLFTYFLSRLVASNLIKTKGTALN